MIYDYRWKPEKDDVGHLIDSLSPQDEQSVIHFIKQLKSTEGQRSAQKHMNWLRSVIAPILHGFAEMSCSVIELQYEETELHVLIKSQNGCDITGLDIRFAIFMADYIGINTENTDIQIHLIYSVSG